MSYEDLARQILVIGENQRAIYSKLDTIITEVNAVKAKVEENTASLAFISNTTSHEAQQTRDTVEQMYGLQKQVHSSFRTETLGRLNKVYEYSSFLVDVATDFGKRDPRELLEKSSKHDNDNRSSSLPGSTPDISKLVDSDHFMRASVPFDSSYSQDAITPLHHHPTDSDILVETAMDFCSRSGGAWHVELCTDSGTGSGQDSMDHNMFLGARTTTPPLASPTDNKHISHSKEWISNGFLDLKSSSPGGQNETFSRSLKRSATAPPSTSSSIARSSSTIHLQPSYEDVGDSPTATTKQLSALNPFPGMTSPPRTVDPALLNQLDAVSLCETSGFSEVMSPLSDLDRSESGGPSLLPDTQMKSPSSTMHLRSRTKSQVTPKAISKISATSKSKPKSKHAYQKSSSNPYKKFRAWPRKYNIGSGSSLWIQCDVCKFWFHYGCANVRKRSMTVAEKRCWKCPPCRARPIGEEASINTDEEKLSCARPNCTLKSEEPDVFAIEYLIGFSRIPNVGFCGHVDWYLVKWQGYALEQSTWEQGLNLHPDLIKDYEAKVLTTGTYAASPNVYLLPEAKDFPIDT